MPTLPCKLDLVQLKVFTHVPPKPKGNLSRGFLGVSPYVLVLHLPTWPQKLSQETQQKDCSNTNQSDHADVMFVLKAEESEIRSNCSFHVHCLHCISAVICLYTPGVLHLFDLGNLTIHSANRTGSAGSNSALCAFFCSEHDLMGCISKFQRSPQLQSKREVSVLHYLDTLL